MAKRPPVSVEHPVTTYARDVVGRRIVAGRPARLACERHLRDLETGSARGLTFEPVAADDAINFFGFLKHSKGEWSGTAMQLEAWQKFIVGSIFGWKRADGTRRFRSAYMEVARKNGKSTLAAGIGLFLLIADGEPGAEIYTAATKRDQAKIIHDEATRMVKASPSLKKRVLAFKDNLHVPATASKYEPLGADADTTDGLNPHGVIIDELHAHKTRAMWDVLDTGTGARRQPLLFACTTAGAGKVGVCREQHEYGQKILEGTFADDSTFAYIATLDEGDDWTDPSVWIKANPNLGVSVKAEALAEQCEQAKAMPTKQNAFRQKRCNQWTEQVERWLPMDKWAACGTPDLPDLTGRRCFAGLDLSSTSDITALVLTFPPEDEDDRRWVMPFFWLPEETAAERDKRDRVPYLTWARLGLIELTPGNCVDYAFVRERLRTLRDNYEIAKIGLDPWNAQQLALQLKDDGFEVEFVRQGFASLSGPSKELEKYVVSGELAHGGHKVLEWMAGNVAVDMDPAGNIKPNKKESGEKIDGIVATVMSIGVGATAAVDSGGSVYETRGVLSF